MKVSAAAAAKQRARASAAAVPTAAAAAAAARGGGSAVAASGERAASSLAAAAASCPASPATFGLRTPTLSPAGRGRLCSLSPISPPVVYCETTASCCAGGALCFAQTPSRVYFAALLVVYSQLCATRGRRLLHRSSNQARPSVPLPTLPTTALRSLCSLTALSQSRHSTCTRREPSNPGDTPPAGSRQGGPWLAAI